MLKNTALAPILYTCMFFGLYNKFAENTRSRIRKVLKHIYNLFFTVLCAWLIYIGVYYVRSRCIETDTEKIKLILKVLTGGMSAMVAIVSTFMRQSQFMGIACSIETRDQDLVSMAENATSKKANTLFFGQLMLILLIWIYHFVIFHQIFITKYGNNVACCLYIWTVYNYPSLISHIYSIMFSALVLTYRNHFVSLNHVLLKCQKEEQNIYQKLLALKKMQAFLVRDLERFGHISSFSILFKFLNNSLLTFTSIYSLATKYDTRKSWFTFDEILLAAITIVIAMSALLNILLSCKIAGAECSKSGVMLHKLYYFYRNERNTERLVRKCFSVVFNY